MNYIIIKTDEKTEYKLAKQSVVILQQFLDWTKTVLPNPFADVKQAIAEGLPEKYVDELFKEAKKKASLRGTINDPDVKRLMETMEGATHLFYLRLKAYHPDLQPADTIGIIDKASAFYGPDKWKKLFKKEVSDFSDSKLTEEQAERFFSQRKDS